MYNVFVCSGGDKVEWGGEGGGEGEREGVGGFGGEERKDREEGEGERRGRWLMDIEMESMFTSQPICYGGGEEV